MKKIKYLLTTIVLILIWGFTIDVYAVGASLSVSSGSVYKGDTFTVSVNATGVASWEIHVTSSGPVSGCSINEADATANAQDTNKTFTATCTTTGTGTITVDLTGNVTSASDGNAVDISGSRTVTVTEKPAPAPTPTPSNNNNNNNNNDNQQPAKSSNNKLKEIKIDGYELVKVDDKNYTLTVANEVDKVNIVATSEDSKATVAGAGEKALSIGDNDIEVVVTAEDGSQNKINLKITREEAVEDDSYVIEDDDVDVEEPVVEEEGFNIIPIIMIGLAVILAIAVVILYVKNKKEKEEDK